MVLPSSFHTALDGLDREPHGMAPMSGKSALI